ncbi:hypothetical protein X943_001137 [Babesia divergens]|uniref:Mitochondrial import receptor subunit TOM40 n=1 Tax=Babesia divergens TaxID=32595 RepID=A0AAD9GFA3_BABDI|nr:hypothetical protein X943_001137 [Babesia divergens]
MSFLRAFRARSFTIFPRVATDGQANRGDDERGGIPNTPGKYDAGLIASLNARCSNAYASWRKRLLNSRSVMSALLPSQFSLGTHMAHCDEQAAQPDQTPVVSPYELLVFENLSREFKNIITQDNYDGFRLEADRPITDNIQCSHSLFLGTVLRDVGYLYQVGANYSSSDGNYLAMAKIGLDGMITARALAKYGDNVEVKVSGNSFLQYDTRNAYEGGIDYLGRRCTASLKGAWQGTWILNAAYTQQIVPSLTLGSELTYIWSKQPNFKSLDFTLQETDCARLQYVRRISDRLSVATELELTPATQESALRVGWDYVFRHARVQGNIDSAGRIAMQAQDFSGFGISGYIDYWNNIYRFGCMMHLLPPPPPEGEPKVPAPEVST